MEQNRSWKANIYLFHQEISTFYNPHPITSAVLSQMNGGQTLKSYFLKICFSIIFPLNPRFSGSPIVLFEYFVFMHLPL
jgi:hypothetical protein